MILNERLMSHVQNRELIHPSQIGFMPDSRTTDHILTLKTIHDNYVSQQKMERSTPVLLISERPSTPFGTKVYF